MGDIDSYFTEAIIGKPILVTLGTPIKHDVEPAFISGAPTAEGPAEASRRSGRALRLGIFGLLAAAIGIVLVYFAPLNERQVVAQVAAPAKPASAPASAPQAEASTPEASIPIMSASAAAPAEQTALTTGEILPAPVSISISSAEFATETAAPSIPVAAAKPATSRVQQPPKKAGPSAGDKVEKHASIIVDGAAPKPTAPAQAAAQALPTPAAPPSSARAVTGKLVSPAVETASAAPAIPGKVEGPRITLVDIDKAGAYALITNPQTRLPQKVEVGQKIFTGETVLKIDPKAGRIHLDSGRAVNMQ